MRVSANPAASWALLIAFHRIVEYATREQAQNAVNTLSNQSLMGRLVYVREVTLPFVTESASIWRLLADRRF